MKGADVLPVAREGWEVCVLEVKVFEQDLRWNAHSALSVVTDFRMASNFKPLCCCKAYGQSTRFITSRWALYLAHAGHWHVYDGRL